MTVNQCGLSSSSKMRASYGSSSIQTALKMFYFALSCYCGCTTAMVLPTQSLFNKQTATFNVTNPVYLQNIKPKKVLAVLEETFKEVLAETQNETSSITDQGENHRRRRMLQTDRNMLTLTGNQERRLKTKRIKAIINHFPSKAV
ncbi:hypothetical protein LOAG_07339 [Loa loa]|uniref:Transcription factor BTF3 n=1 Tax=Loa loa TaxID=7209 RepID=A0A1I7VTN0_LOALO|nr:hypothetical protein LOAG_07339 [Loa loa]EFO21150.1 hypothetical protein LOAG_07339 [Loa loa]